MWYNKIMDIMLNTSNNSLVWENGDLKLVDGLALIKQHILTALYTLKGDWLLDYEKGIDYPRGFRNEAFMLNDVRKQISGVDGVISVKKLKLTKENLVLNITGIVLTEFGNIELNEVMEQWKLTARATH